MQQYLIPLKTGDELLLMTGWAGDLTELELEFVEERLRRSHRLSKEWGIISGDYSEAFIRHVALGGLPPGGYE